MIDLETFIRSLKITWIKRIIESDAKGILNKLYMQKLKPFGGSLLFECNLTDKDVDKIAKNNNFLRDILLAWCSCNAKTAILSYRNEIIWNNTHINADGNTFIYLYRYQKGIKYFRDIYNDTTNKLYTFERLKDIFDLP